MKEQTNDHHWLLCIAVALTVLALYPNFTAAQSDVIPEEINATGTTIYATTSTGELLPVPTEAMLSTSTVPTTNQTITNVTDQPLSPLTQTRIINLAANISNRLDTALVRLQNIHARMVRRAELLQASGQDTRSAETTLAESTVALDRIAERLAPIDTLVYAATTAPTPKTAWAEVSKEYIEIANDLRAAKAQLITALTQLKNTSPVAISPTASTTDSETINP